MNVKSRELKARFDSIMVFQSKEDQLEHESKILMFKFLSLIEHEMAKSDMSKKELAEVLNTSASYVTEILRGQKTINLLTLAKLQQIFGIEFKIIGEKINGISISNKGKRKQTSAASRKGTGISKKSERDHAL